MKIAIIKLISFALSLILYSFANPNADTYSLTIEVKNLRNEKGVVQFALYNKDGSIPDEDYENYYVTFPEGRLQNQGRLQKREGFTTCQ